GHESLPGRRRAAESLVAEQVVRGLFVYTDQTQRAHRGAHALQRFDLPGPLARCEQDAALVGRLGQAPDESPVALIARQVAALAGTALQQRLPLVAPPQARACRPPSQELGAA